MKLNFNQKIINIRKLLLILWSICILIGGIILIRKIYIRNNTYSEYKKSMIAEIIDSKVVTHSNYSKKRNRKTYKSTIYKIRIKETEETIELEDEFSNRSSYKNGEEVLLTYYNLYDKNSNKRCGQNYSIKPLSYFNNGSFLETTNHTYIFCNSNNINRIIHLKIDYPDDRMVKKDSIWFYADSHSHDVTCHLSTNITEELINMIENRENFIEVTETSFGTLYNFEYHKFHFSVLNYGRNIKESLVLKSTSKKNIVDFITNMP